MKRLQFFNLFVRENGKLYLNTKGAFQTFKAVNDTTHFLRKLDDLKELPPGSILVVSSLYTNITHNEGIEAHRKALNSSGHLSRSHLKTESMINVHDINNEHFQIR